jgi:hypothetical protein
MDWGHLLLALGFIIPFSIVYWSDGPYDPDS